MTKELVTLTKVTVRQLMFELGKLPDLDAPIILVDMAMWVLDTFTLVVNDSGVVGIDGRDIEYPPSDKISYYWTEYEGHE